MDMLVREYAERSGLSVGRVHQLIDAGQLPARRSGNQYLIPEAGLGRRANVSRPLSHASAWALIDLLSGRSLDKYDPVIRHRVRKYRQSLAASPEPARQLNSWLRSRAERIQVSAKERDLDDLRRDKRVMLSGISDERSGLGVGRELEGYVDPVEYDALVREYLLVRSSEQPNVWMHVAAVQREKDGRVPLGLVIADLADHNGPREDARVEELLRQ